jgi:hypothetical protein
MQKKKLMQKEEKQKVLSKIMSQQKILAVTAPAPAPAPVGQTEGIS